MVRARRLLSGAAIAAAFLTACSGTGQPTTLVVRASVLDGAGSPVAGALVRGRRGLDVRDIDTARHTELDSLGLACIDERRPPACNDGSVSASTDRTGAFTLSFRADQIGPGRAVVGAPDPLDFVARRSRTAGELSGPATSRQLAIVDGEVAIDPLVLWAPALELSTGPGGDGVLRWTGDPPAKVSNYRVLVEDSGGRLVWSERTERAELALHLSDLDGTRGAVSVVGIAADGTDVWRSARAAYRADDGSVRLALADEVGWPFERGLSSDVVLVAIVSLLGAAALLVVAGGVVNRRNLGPRPRGGPRRARR